MAGQMYMATNSCIAGSRLLAICKGCGKTEDIPGRDLQAVRHLQYEG
jgi:hypothetical protein